MLLSECLAKQIYVDGSGNLYQFLDKSFDGFYMFLDLSQIGKVEFPLIDVPADSKLIVGPYVHPSLA